MSFSFELKYAIFLHSNELNNFKSNKPSRKNTE